MVRLVQQDFLTKSIPIRVLDSQQDVLTLFAVRITAKIQPYDLPESESNIRK